MSIDVKITTNNYTFTVKLFEKNSHLVVKCIYATAVSGIEGSEFTLLTLHLVSKFVYAISFCK